MYGVGFVLVLNFHRAYSRALQYRSIIIDLVFEVFVKNCTLDLAASRHRFAFAFKILILGTGDKYKAERIKAVHTKHRCFPFIKR